MNNLTEFKEFIWHFYHTNKRDFAWRNIDNPYFVLVSEIMLQQTQTHRVVNKYQEFITRFNTLNALATASLHDVLTVWQGLGYYRRARFLHQLAQKVVTEYAGSLPQDPKILQRLPGIGPNTAGSMCAFAFNQPAIFIETNIRTVFLHSFFRDKADITDKELFPLIAATVDQHNPREWYYALMDYGVFLKSHMVNPNRKSAHYTKQSKFKGSDRQIRAQILKLIVNNKSMSHQNILQHFGPNSDRIERIIKELISEHFLKKINDIYFVA